MDINLPNSAYLGNIDPFLRSFNPSKPAELRITANKKWISIHPVVLSMVAALGLTVGKAHTHCEKLEAKSKHYLERMGLFRLIGIPSEIRVTEHEPSDRFIPLTQIKTSAQLSAFITNIVPLLHIEPKKAEPIRYIVSEIVRNVFEHSMSEYGAIVSAQYYQRSNTVRIGIADTGVGIKKTINRAYNAKTDEDALVLALTPGITGTTRKEGGTEFNAGAGLFFIKSIAKVNRDFFIVYSGKAMYKLLKNKSKRGIKLYADPLKDRHSIDSSIPAWQGTVVGIDISLDSTEEFSLLLDLIRDTYVTTIRERKKARYRRPKFT